MKKNVIKTIMMCIVVVLCMGSCTGIFFQTCTSSVKAADRILTSDDGTWDFTTYGKLVAYHGTDSTVIVPESVTSAGSTYYMNQLKADAISNNTTTEVIMIGTNITYPLTDNAFDGLIELRAINVAADNKALCSIDGILYTKNKTTGQPERLLRIPQKVELTTYNMPASVTSAYARAAKDNITIYYFNSGASFDTNTDDFQLEDFFFIKGFTLSSTDTQYTTVEGVLYNKDVTTLVYYPWNRDQNSYTFPETVVNVTKDCFKNGATNLQNINFTNPLNFTDEVWHVFDTLGLTSVNGASNLAQYRALDNDTREKIIANLRMLDSQAVIVNMCDEEIDRFIAESIDDSMTIYEKLDACNNYMCDHVYYNNKNEQVNGCVSAAFLADRTVCNGYALGLSLLLDRLGITCYYVGSRTATAAHAYNLVQIDGIWLTIDSCWNDGLDRHKYFLKTSDEIQAYSSTPDYAHIVYEIIPASEARFAGYNITVFPDSLEIPDYNPLMGDMNLDGYLDYTDKIKMGGAIRSYSEALLAGQKYYDAKADMNRDGAITDADYDLLLEAMNASN